MKEWKNLYRGFIMGISDLIPGVSGGTLAVLLGIYDRLLASIGGFFSKNWKKHLLFLLPLGVGMLSAIFLLSNVIEYLLEYHLVPTQFFFVGLAIGVIPFMVKESDMKNQFKSIHYLIIVIGAILLASLSFMDATSTVHIDPIPTIGQGLLLFFSGWLASMAMLLPGISGSFILLLIGVYPVAISAVSNLNFYIIACVGAGVAVGFILSSKGIQYALKNFRNVTYAIIIGLIIGSIFVIFPGIPSGWMILVSIVTFLAGLMISHFLGSINQE